MEEELSPDPDEAPRYNQYPDTGCELAGACLNCPYPLCHYDDPALARRLRNIIMGKRLLYQLKRGRTLVEAAAAKGLTLRTAERRVAEYREAKEKQRGVEFDDV
ncbi:hypothetical protein ABFB09_01945 [Dehalogenimonas sp. THU2]|uniref:hypothetical protein n=1 Tax=Dehalogenimonas sp. THU2 TaxID=3151121 RepID=UPI0032181721